MDVNVEIRILETYSIKTIFSVVRCTMRCGTVSKLNFIPMKGPRYKSFCKFTQKSNISVLQVLSSSFRKPPVMELHFCKYD